MNTGCEHLNCPAEISFGLDVRRPGSLETRSTGDVLTGIYSGRWQDTVARVRSLPTDSKEQEAAKVELPYCTWAGVFHYRSSSALSRHSGQVGMDLDALGEAGAVAVLQTAMKDKHCLAAYRSVRGEGVRLLFRVPPCSAREHPSVFEQVAEHVRNTYGHGPDPSGKDVSRPSFVSFDNGLWFFGQAELLPIQLQGQLHKVTQRDQKRSRCVTLSVYGGQLAMTCWSWYGRYLANTLPRADGTAKTHRSLLDLGKSIALHSERIREPLTERHIYEAFDAWLAEHARRGVQLRGAAAAYRSEFVASVKGATRKPWFKAAAEKWIRWTRHKDFPKHPYARLLFAIRQHCADPGSAEFFLGARDAGIVGGVSFKTGAQLLRKLITNGQLEKATARRHPRHAQTYRLKK